MCVNVLKGKILQAELHTDVSSEINKTKKRKTKSVSDTLRTDLTQQQKCIGMHDGKTGQGSSFPES